MSLQISTREHDSNRPGVRIGAVTVEGECVCAEFMFGGAFRATREEAEAQARLFVMAMEGARMVDKLKAVQASLSETIARLEGRA